MRAGGYEPEDFENDVIEVWPENWPAVVLFSKMNTQWNTGFGGATGLNHLVLFAHLDRMKLNEEEANLMFDDIRHMEIAALEEMRKG